MTTATIVCLCLSPIVYPLAFAFGWWLGGKMIGSQPAKNEPKP